MKCRLWLTILLASPMLTPPLLAQAQPPARFAPRDLAPARNHLSNPSFEAPATESALPSFTALTGPESFALTREQALHGAASLRVDVPAAAGEPAVLAQIVPGCGGCRYELTGWTRQAQGAVTLRLEALGRLNEVLAQAESTPASAPADAWGQLSLTLASPADTETMRVSIVGAPGASAHVDALRLALTRGPKRKSFGPRVRDLKALRNEPTWLLLHWAGPDAKMEVTLQLAQRRRAPRLTVGGVEGFTYSFVGLQPETEYRVGVRVPWLEFYDEQGQVVATPPVSPTPAELLVTTPVAEPRETGLLRIGPVTPLQVGTQLGHNPRLEASKEHLYLAQEYDGGIMLAKLAPDTLQAVWTRQIVSATVETPVRLLDTYLQADMLLVLLQRRPDEASMMSFNLASEQAEGETVLPLVTAPTHLGGVALAGFRNDLWVVWVEETGEASGRRGLLRAGLFANGRFTRSVVWDAAPVPVVGEPSVGSLGDELLISFTDAVGAPQAPGVQALYLVSFNGLEFTGLRKLRDVGWNGQPRGRQLGPNFYLAYASDASYLGRQGRTRDLMLATLPPGGMSLETVTVLDDRKLNVTPDVAALGDVLWIVHEKLEPAPTPRSYGVFIGRVDFGPARRNPQERPRDRRGPQPLFAPTTPAAP